MLMVAMFLMTSCVLLHAEQKIAFADKLKVLFEYKKSKELNERLEKENQQAKEDFDKKAQEVKNIRDEMELLSETARKRKSVELEAKLKALDEFRVQKQREISKKYDDGIREISEEIAEISKKYGKANKYDAIIDSRATIYFPDSLDVTDEVLKELNK